MSFWTNKRVVVTGGAGFVGSHLVGQLGLAGAQVVVIDDFSHGIEANLCDMPCDITLISQSATSSWKHYQHADAVFNLAATVGGVAYNERYNTEMFAQNIDVQTQVPLLVAQAQVPLFCQVSSACVYSEQIDYPARIQDGHAGLPSKSNLGYGLAKRAGEYAAQALTGTKAVIVRPTGMYGPRDWFDPIERAHVIPALIRRTVEQEKVVVWGDGEQIRSFMHARDGALGMMQALEICAHNTVSTVPIFNLAPPTHIRVRHLVWVIHDLCCRLGIISHEKEIIFDDTKPAGMPIRTLHPGFPCSISLSEGLKETIEWYMENKNDQC